MNEDKDTQQDTEVRAADSRGAVDLAAAPARTAQPDGPGDGLRIPLVTETDEAGFQDVMSTSQAVPVVLVLWSQRSLESKPTMAALEEIAREKAGAFQLVEVEIEAAPQIAQAFQIQAVPSVIALVGARPLPLFQGSAAKEQIVPVIDQVLEAAVQMGVTGRVAVSAEQTQEPTPPEHEAPLAAEAEGRLADAVAAWERVIELNPRDEAAKAHLSRVRLARRSAEADGVGDPASRADALFAAGDQAGAFQVLLDLIGAASDAEEREALRQRLVDLFRVAGATPEVKKARTLLSMLLM